MRQLQTHPTRVLAALLLAAFVLFMLSGIPRFRDAKSGVDLAVGDVFWFGFLLAALTFVIAGISVVVRAMRRRSAA